jgi:diaminopimelate decarboxylase
VPNVRTDVSVDGGMSDNPRPITYGARYSALLANRRRRRRMSWSPLRASIVNRAMCCCVM